jgi:hypothetical protein
MKTVHFIPNLAATVAVATPCWPAPVSAITRCTLALSNVPTHCFPKSFRDKHLSDRIVDLMAPTGVRNNHQNAVPSMIEIFTLEPDFGASYVASKTIRKLKVGGAIHVWVVRAKFFPEEGIVYRSNKCVLEFNETVEK